MKTRRRMSYALIYAILTAAGLLLVAGANWAVDPLHFYRRPFLHHTFISNDRYQNPGLIQNYDYDAIIIGTSHSQNFSLESISRVLGWKAMPLAMSGSTAHEQFLVLNKALQTGKVRDVLWGLDFGAFQAAPDRLGNTADSFPLYLYEVTAYSHVKYLLSLDTLILSAQALGGLGPQSLETRNTWFQNRQFSEEQSIRAWRQVQATRVRTESRRFEQVPPTTPIVNANVLNNLVPALKSHPHVRFHLFFPPFSILACVDDHAFSKDQFPARMDFKRQVVAVIGSLNNCRLYDFEAAQAVTHDLNNYCDHTHYNQRINNFIVEAVARDDFRLSAENSEEHLTAFENSVHDFLYKAAAPPSPSRKRPQMAVQALHLSRDPAPSRTHPARTADVTGISPGTRDEARGRY